MWEVFHSAKARPWDTGEWNSEEGRRAMSEAQGSLGEAATRGGSGEHH